MKTAIILIVGILQLLFQSPESIVYLYDNYITEGNKAFHKGDLKKALVFYSRAKNACEEKDKALNNQAVVYAQYKRYSLGIDRLNEAVEFNPQNETVYFNRAVQHLAAGNLDASIDDFEEAEGLGFTNSPNLPFYKAVAHFKKGDYEQVHPLYEEEQRSDHHEFLYLNGLAYYNQQKYTEAETYFTLASEKSDIVHYKYGRALASHFNGNTDGTLDMLSEDYDGSEEGAQIYNTIGNLAIESGNLEEAQLAFEKVLQRMPSNADALAGMGTIAFMLDEAEDAVAFFERTLVQDAKNVQALNGLGNLALEFQKFDKAISFYDRILQFSPSDESALFGIALAHMSKVDPFQCLDHVRKINKKSLSGNALDQVIFLEAYAMSRKNEMDKAVDLLTAYQFKITDKKTLRTQLAYYYLKLGQLHKVTPTIGSMEYNSYYPYLLAGNASLQTKQYVEAYKFYRKAFLFNPNDVDVLNGMAMSMVYNNRRGAAVALIDSLNRTFPDNYYIKNSRGIIYKETGVHYINDGRKAKAHSYLEIAEEAFLDAKKTKPAQGLSLDNNRALALYYGDKFNEAIALLQTCPMLASKNNLALVDIGKHQYSSAHKQLKKLRDDYYNQHKKSITYLEHNIKLAARKATMNRNYKFITFYFLHQNRPPLMAENPFGLEQSVALDLPNIPITDYVLEESELTCDIRKTEPRSMNKNGKKAKSKKSYSGKCPSF